MHPYDNPLFAALRPDIWVYPDLPTALLCVLVGLSRHRDGRFGLRERITIRLRRSGYGVTGERPPKASGSSIKGEVFSVRWELFLVRRSGNRAVGSRGKG